MMTYKGYHIVGMDDVRPTKDMLKKGYRGCQVMTKNDEGKKETHYLKNVCRSLRRSFKWGYS